jgi:hypothetical protein
MTSRERRLNREIKNLKKDVRRSQRATSRRGYTTDNCSEKQSKIARKEKQLKKSKRRW